MTHFRYFSIVSLICLLAHIHSTFSKQLNDDGQDEYDYESADYDYDQDERGPGQNFNAFSDAELSAALYRLSTRELNRLSHLMATEDATDHRNNKRECQQGPCSDSSEVSGFTGDERDQVASIRGWFRKRKPTTTTTTTTTVRPTKAKVTKRKPTRAKKVTKPRKKSSPRKLSHQIADDVKLYGNDRSAKAVLDRNVHTRVDILKSKLRNVPKGQNYRHRRNPLKNDAPLSSETAGFLEDSFPDLALQTDLFRQPLESLVRVKRNNA